MLKKIFLIHIFFFFISLLIKYYHVTGSDLIWNMFLALITIDLAFLVYYSHKKIIKWIVGFGWFFFYPNTFYMLTDIVHMHFTGEILTDRTSMIYFMLFMSSILFGVLSGIESLKIILISLSLKNYYTRLFFIAILSLISSFAIHIGRYARLNTWDLVLHPKLVMKELLEVISYNALPFILGFTFLQILCLVFLESEKISNKY